MNTAETSQHTDCPQCALDIDAVTCPGIHIGNRERTDYWVSLEVDGPDYRALMPCNGFTHEADQLRILLSGWVSDHLHHTEVREAIETFIEQIGRDHCDRDTEALEDAAFEIGVRWRIFR